MKTNIHFFWIGLLLLLTQGMTAQQMVLSLEKTIQLAADSSLEAFRSKNLYLTGYWEFRNYKAERLPNTTATSPSDTTRKPTSTSIASNSHSMPEEA